MIYLFLLFWVLMFYTLCFQYMMPLMSISGIERFIAMMVFLVGAPFFFIVNVLNNILDCIFPEGWDNEGGY